MFDASTAPTKQYAVHVDQLDRPLRMTDADKAVVWDAYYEPFGGVVSLTGPAALDLRLPGQWFQIEAGLAYNWHRHYDPTLGRYTQPDPLGVDAGASLYGYAGQSPQMNVDPDGRIYQLLATPFGRAIAGAIIGAGVQVGSQYFLEGKSFGCIDAARVYQGAVFGALLGYYGGSLPAAGLGPMSTIGPSASVPGRVLSRINVSNEGWAHVLSRHYSGTGSQFSISQNELRSLLGSKQVVGSPVVRTLGGPGGARYMRQIETGRMIGIDKFTGESSTILTVVTDRFGNLVSTFPGIMK